MEPLSVPDAILKRRSTKDFLDRPIDDETIDRLVELTRIAPSSWNLQPWRVVLVRSAERRQRLHEACFRQRQIIEAPITFVFAVDIDSWQRDRGRVIAQAKESGAWSDGYCQTASKAIPAGQKALEDSGRLREYAIKDAMIAATQTALAAESFGLHSTFMNGWIEEQVKAVIGAAGRDEIAIAVLLPVGYARQVLSNPGRLPREETFFDEELS
ncbi:MAG TPA: nitroreductase [Planctomycetes bacterium]|nr:nitroreductase [Planctomycetota bacterium]